MDVNIELKTGIYWYPTLEEKVMEIVKNCGMEERVIYSSFNHYSVQKIRELDSKAETAYLYSDVILDVENYAKEPVSVDCIQLCIISKWLVLWKNIRRVVVSASVDRR